MSRPDGSKIVIKAEPDWKVEAVETCKAALSREMLLLTPLFVYTGWFYPYQFGVCPRPPGGGAAALAFSAVNRFSAASFVLHGRSSAQGA